MGNENRSNRVFLNSLGLVNALGSGKEAVWKQSLAAHSPGMTQCHMSLLNRDFLAGKVVGELPAIPESIDRYSCRNNRLALAALKQIETDIRLARERYSPQRIGVVLGTSTSGVDETEKALTGYYRNNEFPADYHYSGIEIGSLAPFVADYCGVTGPCYVASTACSSSARVFATARGLINLDICDAVIVGGVDSLCNLTLGGFSSLEAVSAEVCNPFSVNRKGINIGEAAALFLMTREVSAVELRGVGESSDAWHMSAPEPEGKGAREAMGAALADAAVGAEAIDYINLHGTGTKLNDAMESHAIFSMFGDNVLCSSTKPLTGHTLGAAGATEIAFCWLMLNDPIRTRVIRHVYDGENDPDLSKIQLASDKPAAKEISLTLSNSFAFGGNNVAVILGSGTDD